MTEIVDNRTLSTNPDSFVADPVEVIYQDKLGDGLEAILAEGAETLDSLVDALNSRGVTGRLGTPWTTGTLEAELRRLAR